MKKLTATFRIVTPMFLGGAEPAAQAELRVPSIKGALRFWWRALMWGKVKDIAELRQKEAELFGSSDLGQSQFLMRLDAAVTEANTVQEMWPQGLWQRYSGYGLRDKEMDGRKVERRFLKPGREFAVHFQMRRCNDEQCQQLISAIALLGLVGGLGSRSRKGWGSLTLTKLDGAAWACPATADTWIKTIDSLAAERATISPPCTAFSSGAHWNCGPAKKDAATAQQWLGQQYQAHVKSTEPKASRAQFGLPREFKNGTPPRRASPLLLHIHQCPNGQALPAAIWLPSDFRPNDKAIPGGGNSARKFVENLSTAQ